MNIPPEAVMDDRIVMLLYRLTHDYDGAASMPEVRSFGVWAEPAAHTAIELGWLRNEPSTETLEVTSDGRQALSEALGSVRTLISGGSVPDEGPRFRLMRPRWESLWHLQRGLTRRDFDPILDAETYEGVYNPVTLGFPGLMHYHTTLSWSPDRDHPLAGLEIDPRGYPGVYVVALTLRRPGAPDNPHVVEMDQRLLEGDSHLHLPEGFRGELDSEGRPQVLRVEDVTEDGETVVFALVPNKWGRLGKILTELKADGFEAANRKAYKVLLPILCDLSYRYDVPLDVLQVNAVEKTTLTHAVEKVPDYREAILPEDPFNGGVNYADFPGYTTFAYLYREGLNSSSIAYGFLCFFKVIEGILKIRATKAAKGERRRYDNEKVVGELAEHFDEEFHGKRFGYVIDKMRPMRARVAHAFLDRESPDIEDSESLNERLELEVTLSPLRSQAREMVRVMMHNEYWVPHHSDPSPGE